MKRKFKSVAAVMMASAIVAPAMSTAVVNAESLNSKIQIDLERTSVVLGSTSDVSVKFKENPGAESIVLNFICYDMPLDAVLNYNEKTGAYEGTIEFNKDPENLNVWELENIVVNSSSPYTLDRNDLEDMGLDLDSCDITQEIVVDLSSVQSIQRYATRTSAPVTQLIGDNRYGTAIKVSKEGWTKSDKVIIVNRNASIEGIISTPLATTYDAPILLSSKDAVPDEILTEIKRLGAKEIIIVGDTNDVSSKAVTKLQSTGATVSRITGSNNYELSLNVAKKIDAHHDVNKIYVTNGSTGEVDALTIAAKAGEDKQPIILADKNATSTSTYNWLKGESLQTAYFIGGTDVISNTLISNINGITSENVSGNRVYGTDRHETNAAVMKKFYDTDIDALFVAKSDDYIDALTCGPLAAKKKSPILINPTNYVSARHTENLSKFKADKVYQVGGGMKSTVISSIAASVSKHNSSDGGNTSTGTGKTVVLDAGHGGSDSGATSSGRKEKDYTLDTTLATSEYLRSNGINVVLTRDTDKTLTLASRTAVSNTIGPELFTSIHFNSYNSTAKGTEVYYQVADKNGGLTKTAATNVLNKIIGQFGLTNRGIKYKTNSSGKDYYYVLRENDYPSILVECAFIDNTTDMNAIANKGGTDKLGQKIGEGIVQTLK